MHVFVVIICAFLSIFFLFPFVMEKEEKTFLMQKQMISTSKGHEEHPLAGRNTQRLSSFSDMKMFELFNGLCCLPFLLFWFITPGKNPFKLQDTVHVREIIHPPNFPPPEWN